MRSARLILVIAMVAGLVLALLGRTARPPGRHPGAAPKAGETAGRPGEVDEGDRARGGEPRTMPSDWFFAQRAYPSGEIPQEKFLAAVEQARLERASPLRSKAARELASAALKWSQAGPYNIGGRVTAVAAAPG